MWGVHILPNSNSYISIQIYCVAFQNFNQKVKIMWLFFLEVRRRFIFFSNSQLDTRYLFKKKSSSLAREKPNELDQMQPIPTGFP